MPNAGATTESKNNPNCYLLPGMGRTDERSATKVAAGLIA